MRYLTDDDDPFAVTLAVIIAVLALLLWFWLRTLAP